MKKVLVLLLVFVLLGASGCAPAGQGAEEPADFDPSLLHWDGEMHTLFLRGQGGDIPLFVSQEITNVK